MSNVKIQGNPAGSGTFTIASPNSNSDVTINLPAVTGGDFIVSNASGNVGIGTSSPVNYSNYKGLTVADTTGGFVHLRNTANSQQAELGLNGGAGSAYLATYTNTPIQFLTNNTERMRVNAGAPILCLAGGNTSATGTGIAFPATQSASSDANTLDDYEEGTFTPVFSQGFTSPTYGTQFGQYIKVGRYCYFNIRLSIASGTRASAPLQISSLPFTSTFSSGGLTGAATFSYVNNNVIASASTNLPTMYIGNSTTTLEFYRTDNGASFWGVDINGGTPDMYISGWYVTAN